MSIERVIIAAKVTDGTHTRNEVAIVIGGGGKILDICDKETARDVLRANPKAAVARYGNDCIVELPKDGGTELPLNGDLKKRQANLASWPGLGGSADITVTPGNSRLVRFSYKNGQFGLTIAS